MSTRRQTSLVGWTSLVGGQNSKWVHRSWNSRHSGPLSSGWLRPNSEKCVLRFLFEEASLAANLSWWKLEHNSFFWIGLAKWRMTSTKVYLKARKIDNNASVKQKKSESELKVIWEPLYLLKLCYNLKCGHKEIYILSSLPFLPSIYRPILDASTYNFLLDYDRWRYHRNTL